MSGRPAAPSHDVAVVGMVSLDILGRPVEAIPAGGGVPLVDAIRHKPEMLGFLRPIGFMGATG